jgi:FkbM family methyltransferase
MTYFIGRYYELGVQRILDLILNPGDRFVDIGANIGMITLHARSLVGKNGRIDCFEPNPTCAAKILTHLSINNIGNVTIHACALSDHRGELHLNLTSDHSGTATLAKVDGVRHSFLVDVRVGDDVLTGGQPIDVVKIDVEGFELRVLAGMRRTLVAFKPIVITELIESQLNRAGTTSAEVSKFLKDQGYVPFGVGSSRTFLRHELALFAATTNCNDAVWIHPTHKRAEALMEYVR